MTNYFNDVFNDDDRSIFIDALKTYKGYQNEILETKSAQKEQIKRVYEETDKKVNKKDIRKMFNYFIKHTGPSSLREDADILETINEELNE